MQPSPHTFYLRFLRLAEEKGKSPSTLQIGPWPTLIWRRLWRWPKVPSLAPSPDDSSSTIFSIASTCVVPNGAYEESKIRRCIIQDNNGAIICNRPWSHRRLNKVIIIQTRLLPTTISTVRSTPLVLPIQHLFSHILSILHRNKSEKKPPPRKD